MEADVIPYVIGAFVMLAVFVFVLLTVHRKPNLHTDTPDPQTGISEDDWAGAIH